MSASSSRVYWWTEPASQVATELEQYHMNWVQYGSNPFTQTWLRNAIAYYSTILEPNDWQSALGYMGDQGELVKMMVPQARSLIRQMISLVTKQRLAAKCLAETKDNDVANDARLGDSICEHIIYSQQLDRKGEDALELAAVWGMGFYKVTWRSDKGKPSIPVRSELEMDDDGEPIPQKILEYEGDLEITNPTIYDVTFDARITKWEELSWVDVRTIKNRWDLVAQHPELAQEIIALPGVLNAGTGGGYQGIGFQNEDMVFVWEAYHKPSPSLPKGRMVIYASSDCIFYDGPNIYDCIPVVPLKPEPVIGYGHGYPKLCDLLPAQEMFDHSLSAIATNQSATAVQSVLAPRNSNIAVNQIGGLNFIYFTPQNAQGGGKPEPLQLSQSSPETFKFADVLKQNMMEISGINSAVRGAPPTGVTAASAIATLTANALELTNSLAKAYQTAFEEVLTLGILFYSKFVSVPRLISIAGKDSKSIVKEFVGKDLSSIKRVRVTTINPLMNTLGGRIDAANNLLKTGMIKDTEEYFAILEGAPVQKLYNTELSEDNLMSQENEALMEGKPVMALSSDDHSEHVRMHASLLNDQLVRTNSEKINAILQHIEKHVELSKTTDPYLTAMIRTGKMPQVAPPPQGGGPGPSPEPAAPGEEPYPATPAKPAQDMLGRPS